MRPGLTDRRQRAERRLFDVSARLDRARAELEVIEAQLDALVGTMNAIGSAAKGDLLTIDFLADGTTRVAINGQPRGQPIPGADFQRALLKVWLGAKPVQGDLKKALLGD